MNSARQPYVGCERECRMDYQVVQCARCFAYRVCVEQLACVLGVLLGNFAILLRLFFCGFKVLASHISLPVLECLAVGV